MATGVVKDLRTGNPLANASLTLYDSLNEEVTKAFSFEDGTFSIDTYHRGGPIKLIAFKAGYRYFYNLLMPEKEASLLGMEIHLRDGG